MIWAILRPEEVEEGESDEVFTGGDNNERRTSSFHSSVSLDVTLHPFISSLTCISKMRVDEWIGRVEGCKDLELASSSVTKYRAY